MLILSKNFYISTYFECLDREDLWRLREAAQGSNQFSISLVNEFTGKFWNDKQTRAIYKALPFFLNVVQLLNKQNFPPLVVTITDISSTAGMSTDPVAAVRYLKKHGVRMVYTSKLMVKGVNTAFLYLYDLLIREQEIQKPGLRGVGGVSLFAMSDSEALEEVFFNNKMLGVKREDKTLFRKLGCNYCFWAIHWRNRQDIPGLEHPISTRTDNNTVLATDTNVVCLFEDLDSPCAYETLKLKKDIERRLERSKARYSKYLNWPSCDSEDWMFRYWEDYPRLLRIKMFWDPANMFNHCQSVGSKDNSCCPFTLSHKVKE